MSRALLLYSSMSPRTLLAFASSYIHPNGTGKSHCLGYAQEGRDNILLLAIEREKGRNPFKKCAFLHVRNHKQDETSYQLYKCVRSAHHCDETSEPGTQSTCIYGPLYSKRNGFMDEIYPTRDEIPPFWDAFALSPQSLTKERQNPYMGGIHPISH